MDMIDKMTEVLRLLAEIRVDMESSRRGQVNPKLRWCNDCLADLKKLDKTVASEFANMTRTMPRSPTITELREKWGRTDI